MCELFCLASRLPTVATFSLQTFAQHGGGKGSSVDRWGLAAYDHRDVRLYKEPEPAVDSDWLRFIEHRRLPSRLILSHIRRATRGSVSLANTKPFVRYLGSTTHVFAHNGDLGALAANAEQRLPYFRMVGETDSEHAFCLLLERLAPLWKETEPPSIDARRAIVERFAGQLRASGPASFLYAEGDAVFAHGDRRRQNDGIVAPPGLWFLNRHCPIDHDALRDAGIAID
jgi:predicted glutamine amidotransferase